MRPKLSFLVALAPLLVGWSFLDPFHEKVEKGNEALRREDVETAVRSFEEAGALEPSSPIPDFNRGVALSGADSVEAASDAYLRAAAAADPKIAADAFYNLGNLHFDGQQFEPAIDSYLKSLDRNPDDEEARRNLELAVQRLQEQQQQQQQQSQDPNEDEGEDEPPQDQPSQPQDDQDEEPPPDSGDEEQPPPEPEPAPEDRMSREDAERLLNAVETEELKVLEQLQDKNEGTPGGVAHDW